MKGYVTPVKNQAQCGSCWAFSAVVSMEGAHFKKTGKLVSLSEQNLVDCVHEDYGCRGGFPYDGVSYAIRNRGIDTEASYPYTARDGYCHFRNSNVDATHYSFQLYHSGVYNEPRCSSVRLDHGVAAVGYGTENGQQYYLVKNSWGSHWGEGGYIKMMRNPSNQCGIATNACYALA